MRNRVLWIILAVVLLSAGGVWMRSAPASSPRTESPASVSAAIPVQRTNLVRTISAAGRLEALQERSLTVPAGGRVVEVAVEEGDTVEAGDLIVRLDPTSARLKVLQAQREYDHARLESTASVIEEKRLALDAALRELRETEVTAPFPGIVADVGVEVGDQAGAQTVLAQVIDVSRYTVTVEVGEADLPRIRTGQPVAVTVDSLPGVRLSGQVLRVGWLPTSTAEVVVYPVDILLDPTDAPLRPGLSVEVEIVVEEARDVLAVPLAAVAEANGRAFVTRVGPGGTNEPTPVVTGVSDGRMVEIRSGLAEGDRILVNNFRLYEELVSGGGPASGFAPAGAARRVTGFQAGPGAPVGPGGPGGPGSPGSARTRVMPAPQSGGDGP